MRVIRLPAATGRSGANGKRRGGRLETRPCQARAHPTSLLGACQVGSSQLGAPPRNASRASYRRSEAEASAHKGSLSRRSRPATARARWALLQLSEDGRERDHDRRRPPNTCRLSRRDRQRKNRIMRAATTRVASTRAAACPRRAAAAVAAAALWPSGGLMARGAPRGLRASRTNGAHTLHAKMAAWHRSTGVQLRVCVRVCAWVCSRLDECSATPPA